MSIDYMTAACPFCRSRDVEVGEVLIANDDGSFSAQNGCRNCGANGPTAPVDMEKPVWERYTPANNAWNRRPTPPTETD